MAGERGTVNQSVANEVVSESLGLDMNDLGAFSLEDMELQEGNDENLNDDIDPQDDDIDPNDIPNEDEPDDGLSVTHTRNQQQNRQQQQPQKPRPQQRQWNPNQVKTTMDKKGNILGPDGKIVAYAGREARLYNSHHQLRGDFHTLQQTAQNTQRDLTTRLNKAIEIGQQSVQALQQMRGQPNLISEYGLNESQARESLAIAKQSLTDPVGAIKTLLTRATARGIDLTTLGLQPGGFDTKSLMDLVREEIKNATKPVADFNQRTQQTDQQRRENEQAVSQAKADLDNFLGENPSAKNYLHVFNQVFQHPDPKISGMSLGEIWSKLQLNLIRKGIDPDALPQQRSPNGQRQQQNGRGPRLPNGRSNPSGGGNGGRNEEPTNDLAPVEMSYEKILAGVLKDLG